MSDLPKERFAINKKPFSETGIDYFRPIYVKTSREHNQPTEITKYMAYYSHVRLCSYYSIKKSKKKKKRQTCPQKMTKNESLLPKKDKK